MSRLFFAPTPTVVGRQPARLRGNDLLSMPGTLAPLNLDLNPPTYLPAKKRQPAIDRCGGTTPSRIDQSPDIGEQGPIKVVTNECCNIVQILLQEPRIIAFTAPGGCRRSHETGIPSYRMYLENVLSQHA
jgi:hypothetical protein